VSRCTVSSFKCRWTWMVLLTSDTYSALLNGHTLCSVITVAYGSFNSSLIKHIRNNSDPETDLSYILTFSSYPIENIHASVMSTKTSWLLVFKEIIPVYSENHTISSSGPSLCEQNEESMNSTAFTVLQRVYLLSDVLSLDSSVCVAIS
jgi:hypothetical protein